LGLANRGWTFGFVAIFFIVSVSSVGLYLFSDVGYPEQRIRRFIQQPYNRQRPGGGRLSNAEYTPVKQSLAAGDLGKAQILLLREPHSDSHQRLQGLIYLAAGDWEKFVQSANPSTEQDATTLNNVGASFLALSETDPTFLLKALDAFEKAAEKAPNAPEPLFNLVITYRKLRLPRLAENTLQRYAAKDAGSKWYHELANPDRIDESAIVERLEQAVETNNSAEAQRLFESNSELCRRIAMQYSFSNEEASPSMLHFIADEMDRRYGDKTIKEMIAPMLTPERHATVAARDYVNQGAALYLRGNFPESLAAYAEARKLASQTRSLFDDLWIELNEVDTQIRLGQFNRAREMLNHIVTVSRENRFIWLNAKALSIYGYTVKLTASYGEMMNLLSEADRTFVSIDAPRDRIRVLYYLSFYRYGAGDQEQALRLALECLRLTNEDDPLRISTLEWLIGSILYRRGMPERAALFEEESVEQSKKGPNAGSTATIAATLAQLYDSQSKHELSDKYLKIADEAFQQTPEGFDRVRLELWLGLVKARIAINQKSYNEAESLLERNLTLYSQQPFQAGTSLLSPSLMLLARVYSETGRTKKAANKFNEAIEIIEGDDKYLESEKLRVKFDDERRELYDSAINFEFDSGSIEGAWIYLQKYQSKLFHEFLAQFNPKIEQTRAKLDRIGVQQRIPKDTQIIEYALMKNRLLIWLLTDKLFTVRSVDISRAALEDKVQIVLQKLRVGGEADVLLADLGKLLIDPIANVLDPNRTIAIIPDRVLHGLPFAALKRPGSGQYLIQEFPIVVSPSLTHFLTTSPMPARRDEIVSFTSQNGGSAELKELTALQKIYPRATTFVGQRVDKPSFLRAMQKAPIFHYAGHSATDAVDPLRSSILLDGDRSGPNSVTAVDISRQRLTNNAVVILSSCDSSVGNSRDGVGVRGLTSAFLIGGAGSVVGSLWPVEATSTADLMIRFHRAFANSGMPVAEALRQAQVTFLQAFPERSNPYYWSGFVVTGNSSALGR